MIQIPYLSVYLREGEEGEPGHHRNADIHKKQLQFPPDRKPLLSQTDHSPQENPAGCDTGQDRAVMNADHTLLITFTWKPAKTSSTFS